MSTSVRHLILGWDDNKNQKIKEELLKIGVSDKDIDFITERKSRSIIQNKAFKAVPQHYKYICLYDNDVTFDGTDFVKSLSEDLDNNLNIGAAIVPVYQFTEEEIPLKLEPPVKPGEPYLCDINFLTTFNIIMFRRSLLNKGPLFDEDFYGNGQLTDVDTGFEIGHRGFKVVADLRHSLAHVTTNFVGKNLCYHAIVARSRNILREKWLDREHWAGVEDFNKRHPEREIPSVELLTHSSERFMIEYVCAWDGNGFVNCFLGPRFKDLNTLNNYHNSLVNSKNTIQDKYKFSVKPEGVGFYL